jgi:hypothetical protein
MVRRDAFRRGPLARRGVIFVNAKANRQSDAEDWWWLSDFIRSPVCMLSAKARLENGADEYEISSSSVSRRVGVA